MVTPNQAAKIGYRFFADPRNCGSIWTRSSKERAIHFFSDSAQSYFRSFHTILILQD
ncbi:unnamed protein product [Acidithrix sp. C25]|nr:unnamed protein product [Acidithrix sp. C25]